MKMTTTTTTAAISITLRASSSVKGCRSAAATVDDN
jgi:hypothetical protein